MKKYLIAILLFALPALIGGSMLTISIGRFVNFITDVKYNGSFPGQVKIELAEAGDYLVWHKTYAVLRGEVLQQERLPPGTAVDVTRNGESIAEAITEDITLPLNNDRARAVLRIHLDQPGSVTLQAANNSNDEFVLSITEATATEAYPALFTGVAAVFIGVMVGLVLMLAYLTKAWRREIPGPSDAE